MEIAPAAFDYINHLPAEEGGVIKLPEPIRDAGPEVLRQAQEQYAQSHHLTSQQASQVDSTIVLGDYYFHAYEIAYNGMYNCAGLPIHC